MTEKPDGSETETHTEIFEERKRMIAHQMWEDEGQPEGQAERHWSQACLVIMTLTDDQEIENPEWLRKQESNEVPKTFIEAQGPAPEINYMQTKQMATPTPLSTLEELKNRVLKRAAA